jgi:hypothetical protein
LLHPEILTACMMVIGNVVGSIDCPGCRKLAARKIKKILPQLMQAVVTQLATQASGNQHCH